MAAEVREGLRAPYPSLPCKYFYDDRGQRALRGDHPAARVLPDAHRGGAARAGRADAVVERVAPARARGAGLGGGPQDPRPARRARASGPPRALRAHGHQRALPAAVGRRAAAGLPGARGARECVGDFTEDLSDLGPGGGRLLLFFAGTAGQPHPDDVPAFFRRSGRRCSSPATASWSGVDLVKDTARLEAAYNDAAGVTAAFNLNILHVLNERPGGRLRPRRLRARGLLRRGEGLDRDAAAGAPALRVLRAGQPASTCASSAGDEIRTELSCKYTRGVVRSAPGRHRLRARPLVHRQARASSPWPSCGAKERTAWR